MRVSITQSPKFFFRKKENRFAIFILDRIPYYFYFVFWHQEIKFFLEIENEIFKKCICNIYNISGVFHYQKFSFIPTIGHCEYSNKAFQGKKGKGKKVIIRKWVDPNFSRLYKNFNIGIESSYSKTYLILSSVMLEFFFSNQSWIWLGRY